MTAVVDVIVILKEYDSFRRILERNGKRAFIISSWYWFVTEFVRFPRLLTSRLGKSTFLIYLLLRRLELKLPTACQLSNDLYLIFNTHEAHAKPITDDNLRLGHWSDSNDFVHRPCNVFQLRAQCILQPTFPDPEIERVAQILDV